MWQWELIKLEIYLISSHLLVERLFVLWLPARESYVERNKSELSIAWISSMSRVWDVEIDWNSNRKVITRIDGGWIAVLLFSRRSTRTRKIAELMDRIRQNDKTEKKSKSRDKESRLFARFTFLIGTIQSSVSRSVCCQRTRLTSGNCGSRIGNRRKIGIAFRMFNVRTRVALHIVLTDAWCNFDRFIYLFFAGAHRELSLNCPHNSATLCSLAHIWLISSSHM